MRSLHQRITDSCLLLPVDRSDFEDVIVFIVRFQYLNPLFSFTKDSCQKVWSLSAHHYGHISNMESATSQAVSIFETIRMEIYWNAMQRRRVERTATEVGNANGALDLEDLYFYVDEENFCIPMATFERNSHLAPFVEWATQFTDYNVQLVPTQRKICDTYLRYGGGTDGFKASQIATQESNEFWSANAYLCVPSSPTVSGLQSQLQASIRQVAALNIQVASLSSHVGALQLQIADLSNQNADLTTQVANLNSQVVALSAQNAQPVHVSMVPRATLDRAMREGWQLVAERDRLATESEFLYNMLQNIYRHCSDFTAGLHNMFNSVINSRRQ